MASKDEALREIKGIATRHGLTLHDIEQAFETDSHPSKAKLGGALTRVFSYLGGVFIFAGIAVFIGMNWDEMNTAARIIVTLGSGITAYVLAVVACNDPRYEKAATPLFLIAAALQPTGILVAFSEFFTGGDWRYATLITSGIMAVQQVATFWKFQRTTLLFTTLFFGFSFLGIALDLLNADGAWIGLILGFSVFCLSIGIDRTPHRVMTPFWYFVGPVAFLYGLFDILEGTVIELLFLGIACTLIYTSTFVRSRTLLFVSTLAILGYIVYFTRRHFLESIGWPIALVLFGFIMIGLSALAFRINKKYMSD